MSDTTGQTPAIPEDVIRSAAQAVATAQGRGDLDTLMPGDRDYFRKVARAAVRGALAGRTVVELPEPDGYDEADGTWWWNTHLGRMLSRTGKYEVERENNYRATAGAMLAAAEHHKQLRLAAREARRLAAESGQDGA